MTELYDVAGLGNAIVDVIAATDDAFLLHHNIAKSVMTLIDEFRATQLLSVLPDAQEIAGGSAANTMAGLAVTWRARAFRRQGKERPAGRKFHREPFIHRRALQKRNGA